MTSCFNLRLILLSLYCLVSIYLAQPLFAQAQSDTKAPILTDGAAASVLPKTERERAAKKLELKKHPYFDASPSSMSHYGAAKQASTWLSGPKNEPVEIQFVDFKKSLGKDIGTSPWHVVSSKRYLPNTAVTVWGATLTDAYKVLVDGRRFEMLDSIPINKLPLSIPWNLIMVDNGRVIVPDANGRDVGDEKFHTREPSLVILNDNLKKNGAVKNKIEVEHVVTLNPMEIRKHCKPASGLLMRGSVGVSLTPTFTGELATNVTYRTGEKKVSYLVVLDRNLKIITAAKISDSSPSNETPTEDLGNWQTGFYVPTDTSIVKMVYDSKKRSVEKRWERKLPIRGRTGVTPTLMDTSDGERFVVIIDAKAAVSNVLNGLIVQDKDQRPSALIAMRRDDELKGKPAVIKTELTDWLMTVENSPAAMGDIIVVANYSGYLPNGLIVPAKGKKPKMAASHWGVSPDARLDFATGIVALKYDPATKNFKQLWADKATQISGVTAISGGSNRVYGTGAEEKTGMTYFYAYRLEKDKQGPAGERVIRAELGKAPFRKIRRDLKGNQIIPIWDYKLKAGERFDAGNNIVILEDGSLILSLGSGLARIRSK